MSGTWLEQLQPASWRGIPFAVRSSEYPRGRRFALHEYPYRDAPWAEDIGRATRFTAFSGFVVGDDCFEQAQALVAASEAPGAGQLVHPSLGVMTVALIEPLVPSERWDLGRVVELQFRFVETGSPLFPSNANATQSEVKVHAQVAASSSAGDFSAAAGQGSTTQSTTNPPAGLKPSGTTSYTDSKGTVNLVPINDGTTQYQDTNGASTVSLWGGNAASVASDPGLTASSTDGLTPPAGTTYSRYTLGNLSVGTAPPSTVQDALDGQVASNAAVSTAASRATATVSP